MAKLVISNVPSLSEFLTCGAQVWAKVGWYWSPQHVASMVKSLYVCPSSLLSSCPVDSSSFLVIPRVTPHTSYSPMEIPRTIYLWKASSVSVTSSLPTKPNPDSPPVLDTVKVIQYDECGLEPSFIGPTTFFFRHPFSPNIKHVTVSLPYRSTDMLPS